MNKEKFRKIVRRMMRKPIFWSFSMHFIIIIVTSVNLSFFINSKQEKMENPPVFIDLTKVEISEITNLPAKIEKEKPKPEPEKPKPEPEKTKPVFTPPKVESKSAVVEPKVEVAKKIETPTPPSDGARMEAPVPTKQSKKEKPKPKPKKKEVKPKDTLADLGSLLSSIEEVKTNDFTPINYKSEKKRQVSDGIKGGTGGDLSRKVSITDKDALISRIRACWNVEAGVKGAEKIIVEIRAVINNDGSVKSVDILDKGRYNSDYAYRTIAESARRAIYICEKKGEDSPFNILAKKYPDTFDEWRDLHLRFSPIEGVGF